MATITRLRGCENTPCADGSLTHAAPRALWRLSLRPPRWGAGAQLSLGKLKSLGRELPREAAPELSRRRQVCGWPQ